MGYNKACGLVDVGDWAAAEAELRAALKLGRETLLLEDCPEEEVEEELSTLTLQLAYVMSRSGACVAHRITWRVCMRAGERTGGSGRRRRSGTGAVTCTRCTPVGASTVFLDQHYAYCVFMLCSKWKGQSLGPRLR